MTEVPDNSRSPDDTRRVSYRPLARLPVHRGPKGPEIPQKSEIPTVRGLSEDNQIWVNAFIDSDPERIRVFDFIAELEPVKAVRLITRLKNDTRFAEQLFARLSHLDNNSIRETFQGLTTDSDIIKLQEEVRSSAAGNISGRTPKTESKIEIPNGFKLLDLQKLPEGPEKERLNSEAYVLMKKWHYPNVPTHVRAKRGCLYHVPESLEDTKKRVSEAVLCFAVVRETDRRLVAFTEFQADKLVQLHQEGKIHTTDQDIKKRAIKAARNGNVIHEQIIVNEGPGGVGSALVQHILKLAKGRGFTIVSTEIQTLPPNSNSIDRHLRLGYREFGYYEDEKKAPGDTEGENKSFTLYALPLTDKAKAEFEKSITDSPTPKPEEEEV